MATDPSIRAKLLIPEEWANRSCCPVCGSICLSLRRSYKTPDQLACDSCRASFEVSQDGSYVRVISPPPGLPADLVDRWAEPREVITRGRAAVVAARARAEAERARRLFPEPSIDTQALCEQARRLMQLGNSSQKVRATLEGIRGATPEQVEEALAALPERAGRRSGWFWAGLAAVSLLVIAIAAVVGLGLARQQNADTTAQDGLPAAVRVLLASGGTLMNIPPVAVWRLEAGAAVAACPTQPANAARMFGGQSSMWTPVQSAWTILTTQPQTILLPEGLSGEYLLLGDSPRMVAVSGPARLENVVYLSISCPK